jgi:glycerol-3-phosphate dehydrogenase
LEDRPALRDHRGDGLPGAVTVVTEKFTTARELAERTTSLLFRKLGRTVPPRCTAEIALPGSSGADRTSIETEVRKRFGQRLDEAILSHLFQT